jgi:hypothetical protein
MQAEAKDDSGVLGLPAIGVGHGLLKLDSEKALFYGRLST